MNISHLSRLFFWKKSSESEIQPTLVDHFSDYSQKSTKAMRRIGIQLVQQGESLTGMSNKLDEIAQIVMALPSNATGRNLEIKLSEKEILELLDIAERLKTLCDDTSSNLAELLHEKLCNFAGLSAYASKGQNYGEIPCKVAEAVEDPLVEPGTILDIVRQGYRTREGKQLREAIVIVSRSALTNTEEGAL